jgi:HEAT repeat protein
VSEADRRRFLEGSPEEASALAGGWLASGRERELAELVLAALADDSSWTRDQALQRLCALTDYRALLPHLTEALADGGDAERRNAARSAFATLAAPRAARPETALAWLTELLSSADADLRVLVASALGESENPGARPGLERALRDPHPNVVSAAVDALGLLGDPRAVNALVELAAEGEFWTRVAAVVSLGRLGDARALPALTRALREPWLAVAAAEALGEIGDVAALEALRPLVEAGGDAAPAALAAAIRLLGEDVGRAAPEWVRRAAAAEMERSAPRLEDGGAKDLYAARLLGLSGSSASAATLFDALADPGTAEAAAAGVALLPPEIAVASILERLAGAHPHDRLLLLGALPALRGGDEAERVAAYLADPDPEIRAAAAEALGRSPEEYVLPVLQAAVLRDSSQQGAALAYARLGTARCDPLVELLSADAAPVRAAAAEGLAQCGVEFVQQVGAAAGREEDRTARQAMIRALGASRQGAAVPLLLPYLAEDDPALRFAAVQALGRTRHPDAFEPLLAALRDAGPEIRAVAMSALGQLGDARAFEPLSDQLGARDRDLRRTAIFALDQLQLTEIGERLMAALDDVDREVRLTAVRVLRRMGARPAIEALRRVADRDHEARVRHEASRALAELENVEAERQGG